MTVNQSGKTTGKKLGTADITITLKSGQTYKSSSKKVADVNSKGQTTAKKKDTAVITVKEGSITDTCTITVK